MKSASRIKKITLVILSAFFMLCTITCLSTYSLTAKADTSELPASLTTFEMGTGAAIREEGDGLSGIRFTASISAIEFNTITNNGTSEYEFGMLIAKGKFASTEDAVGFLKENETQTKKQATGYNMDEDSFSYNVIVHNVQDNAKSFAVLGYITVGDKTYYAAVNNEGDNIRSLFDVAVGYRMATVDTYEEELEANEGKVEYANSVIKAVKNADPIFTVKEFVGIDGATASDKFVLMNDISLVVNEFGEPTGDNNAVWKVNGSAGTHSVISVFNGTLIGEGHKVSLLNTTALSTDINRKGGGLFAKMHGVIESVWFDISVASPTSVEKSYHSPFIYTVIDGSVKNCYIKISVASLYASWNSFGGAIKIINDKTNLENNIFEIYNVYAVTGVFESANYRGDSSDDGATRHAAYAAAVDDNIVIKDSSSNAGVFAVGQSNRQLWVENSVVYDSVADFFDAEKYGKVFSCSSGVLAAGGYYSITGSPWEDRSGSKFDFGGAGIWTFDYVNDKVTLCGREVLTNA